MNNKQRTSNSLLLTLIILENLFLYIFFKQGLLSQGKNAIGLFLTSLLFGSVLIYKFYNESVTEAAARNAKMHKSSYGLLSLLIVGLIILGALTNDFFLAHPIAIQNSDIIPSIQVMCRRLLSGQFAYSIINDFGFPQQATYLPMQWMPFSIAQVLNIDYRWVAYGGWCVGALWLFARSVKIESPTMRTIIPVMILASYYMLFRNNSGAIEATVELLISGYYMMLIVSLNQRSGILQGVLISFCLLSRYSLVLWIPLYCFVLFVTHNRKQLYLAAATSVVMILLCYVIPFLSKDWGIFYNGYKYYDSAANFEWNHLNKNKLPIQLYSGTGYAYYFYTRFANIDIMGRVKLLQRAHLICSIGVTVILGIWFWFKKEKIDNRIFLLSSFKIYLAVFLFLIQVPYEYLMCVGNFVSIAIFCEQARYRVTSNNPISVAS